ncbi:hypothetical protein MHBO_001342 [Bonamia ostreae]|uniref:Uncharacterized protein n=1 Tax=Bonamia ostreae TaxID=126728 RepID=A0ABV2AIS6_9EUKA
MSEKNKKQKKNPERALKKSEKINSSTTINHFFEILVLTGMKKEEIEKIAEDLLFEEIVSNFKNEAIEKNLSKFEEVPEWIDIFLLNTFGRKAIYQLKTKYDNFFLQYCVKKLEFFGFDENNYLLNVDLSIIKDVNKISNYVETFAKFLSKKKFCFGMDLEEFSKFCKNNFKITKFVDTACFNQNVFSLMQQEILILHNGENGQNILRFGNLLTEYFIKINNFRQCYSLIFPKFFENMEKETKTIQKITKMAFSNDKKNFTENDIENLSLAENKICPCYIFGNIEILSLFAKIILSITRNQQKMSKKSIEKLLKIYCCYCCANDDYFKNDIKFVVKRNLKEEKRLFDFLINFKKIFDSKDFLINFDQNKFIIERMDDNFGTALILFVVAENCLTDRNFYNTSYHSNISLLFLKKLENFALKNDKIRRKLIKLATKIFSIEFPTNFGAVQIIDHHKKLLKTLSKMCIFEYQKVFNFLISAVSKIDYALIRKFTVELIKSTSAPYSKGFLRLFALFLANKTVIDSISAEKESAHVFKVTLFITKRSSIRLLSLC